MAISIVYSPFNNSSQTIRMECRKFELTLISANELEDVRKLFKMEVYCKVSIGSNPRMEKRSPADRHGEINPAWNFSMEYTILEEMIQHPNTMFVIKLYCKRMLGDRYVGEVHAPLKDLFDYAYNSGGSALVSYPVRKGCADSQGLLRFSYRFGQRVSVEKLLLAETLAGWGMP
nr:protein SRC2-like [Ipomoea batatas]